MNQSLFDRKKLSDFRDLVADIDDFIETVVPRYDRGLFSRIRRQTASQAVWARHSGVTQTTIGNWERGYTLPNRLFRARLRHAATIIRTTVVREQFTRPAGTSVDVVTTERSLRHSILRAALTDFDFDAESNTIVPIPFSGDADTNLVSEIASDRQELIESLAKQSKIIRESISDSANLNERKFVQYLQNYESECSTDHPNSRLLNRLGTIIARITNHEDVRGALSSWDSEAIDGFNRDHLELMRLYFREALAKAQEIDGLEVRPIANESDGREFREVASLMEAATSADGDKFIDPDIPTLLRDIANEIRDLNDAAAFTSDGQRREVLTRRKAEAFKNGGVYVGRFVFFSALIASIALPGAGEVLGALGVIVGITEAISPGTIRSQYEALRSKFPALPPLPTGKNDKGEE